MDRWQRKYLEFHCPRWEELPDNGLFSREVVDYIETRLSLIMGEEKVITTTMIQNYTKWGFIPKVQGRKYRRIHLAFLIVITVFKQVVAIEEVFKGVRLQLRLMKEAEGYNLFAVAVEQALRLVFGGIQDHHQVALSGQIIPRNTEGIQMIANAFALTLLGSMIIHADGFENIGVEDE